MGRGKPRAAFILMIVVSMTSILSVLAVTFTLMANMERSVSANYVDQVRARMLASAGIDAAMLRLRAEADMGVRTGPESMADMEWDPARASVVDGRIQLREDDALEGDEVFWLDNDDTLAARLHANEVHERWYTNLYDQGRTFQLWNLIENRSPDQGMRGVPAQDPPDPSLMNGHLGRDLRNSTWGGSLAPGGQIVSALRGRVALYPGVDRHDGRAFVNPEHATVQFWMRQDPRAAYTDGVYAHNVPGAAQPIPAGPGPGSDLYACFLGHTWLNGGHASWLTGGVVLPECRQSGVVYPFAEDYLWLGTNPFGNELAKGEFDAVLAEDELGWTVGHEILRRVKTTHPEVPVILLKGQTEAFEAVEAMREGFEDCVSMDGGGLSRLAKTVRSALARSRDHLHATRRTSSLEETLQRLKVGFFRLSAEGEIPKANRRCLDLLGLATLEDARRFLLHQKFFHAEVTRSVEADLKRDGHVPLTEVLVRRGDGSVGRLCLAESVGRTSVGDAIVDGILLEPGEHPADRVPMATGARVHVALHSLPVLLIVLDRYGHVVWLHGRDLSVLGIDPDECVGRPLTTIGRLCGNMLEDVTKALGGEEVSDTLRIDDHVYRVRMSPLRGSRAVAPEVAVVGVEVPLGVSHDPGNITRIMAARSALAASASPANSLAGAPTRMLPPRPGKAPVTPTVDSLVGIKPTGA